MCASSSLSLFNKFMKKKDYLRTSAQTLYIQIGKYIEQDMVWNTVQISLISEPKAMNIANEFVCDVQ